MKTYLDVIMPANELALAASDNLRSPNTTCSVDFRELPRYDIFSNLTGLRVQTIDPCQRTGFPIVAPMVEEMKEATS